jgi:hypothetical protein
MSRNKPDVSRRKFLEGTGAGSQISEDSFSVFGRALKHLSNSTDTLAMQRVFRFEPTSLMRISQTCFS